MRGKKRIGISGFFVIFFGVIATAFSIQASNFNNKGDFIARDNTNVFATLFWILTSIFGFIGIVTKIVRSHTEKQQEEIEEQKKKIEILQSQNERISELQKQIEELKKKEP